eukprot:3514160-Amphidinium_carterae.1
MVRARNLAPEEQSTNSAIRAIEQDWKAEWQQCVKILKAHPHARRPVLNLLKKMGLSAEPSSVPVPQSLETIGKQQRMETLKRKRQEESAAHADYGEPIPTASLTLDSIPGTVFQDRILPHLHATILSSANLRHTWSKGCTAKHKQLEGSRLAEFHLGGASVYGPQEGAQ